MPVFEKKASLFHMEGKQKKNHNAGVAGSENTVQIHTRCSPSPARVRWGRQVHGAVRTAVHVMPAVKARTPLAQLSRSPI